MKTFLALACAIACLSFASSTFSQTTELLTFDDLPGASNSGPFFYVPGGYGGLQWSNFIPLDGTHDVASGYQNGVVSPNNVIFSGFNTVGSFGNAAGFDLNSAYLTAAWNDGMQVEVRGYIGNTLAYDKTYSVNATGPELINFNYEGITSVYFVTSGGVNHGFVDGGNGTQLVIDNLSITIVPEPASFKLLVCGLAILGFLFLKRAQE